jgi:hypothetical protein
LTFFITAPVALGVQVAQTTISEQETELVATVDTDLGVLGVEVAVEDVAGVGLEVVGDVKVGDANLAEDLGLQAVASLQVGNLEQRHRTKNHTISCVGTPLELEQSTS